MVYGLWFMVYGLWFMAQLTQGSIKRARCSDLIPLRDR